MSNTELRTVLMKLMSRTIPVPLVANRMVNYVDHHDGFEKQYFPELSLIM